MIKKRIIRAYNMAEKAHKGQKRKYSGLDYFVHCKAVARRIENLGGTEDMIIASLLHDTIEDTSLECSDIERELGNTVASLVYELTSDENIIEKMGKANYLIGKVSNMSDEAFTIKLADREHNMKFLSEDTCLDSNQAMKFVKKYYFETKEIMEFINTMKTSRVQTLLYNSIELTLKELNLRFNFEENVKVYKTEGLCFVEGSEVSIPLKVVDYEDWKKLKEGLILIHDLAFDYDGFTEIDSLMSFIDELQEIAIKTLD